MRIILTILSLLTSCQKSIDKYPMGQTVNVSFWTSYSYIRNTPIFLKRWEVENYDTIPFTKLIYRSEEPACNDTAFKIFHAARGRYYAIHYTDVDGALEVDTAIMIPEYNTDNCVFINLNN